MPYFLLLFFVCQFSSALEIEYLADTTLPHDMPFEKTSVGGISATVFDVATGGFYGLSDDRGKLNESRFYFFDLSWDLKSSPKKITIAPKKVIFLKQKGKRRDALDPEGIVRLPWGNFLISSEGDLKKKPRLLPRLLEVDPSGQVVTEHTIPDKFIPERLGRQKKGIRNNSGFEGLTISPDGKTIIAATESSLFQDDEETDFKKGTLLRFVKFEVKDDKKIKAVAEWAYQTEPLRKRTEASMIGGSGVSEILFFSNDELLVLERGAIIDFGKFTNDIRLFLVSLKQTEDISKLKSLKGQKTVKLLEKKLLLDFDTILAKMNKPQSLDNFEALMLGPKLPDGRQSLLVSSDNNFQSIQRSLFVFFALK